jgi:putative serine protease PepD
MTEDNREPTPAGEPSGDQSPAGSRSQDTSEDPAPRTAPAEPGTYVGPGSQNPYAAPNAPAGAGAAPGERVLFGSAFAGHQAGPGNTARYASVGPPTGPIGPPLQASGPRIPEQRRGHGGLIAGITVLALLVGGGAGAAGGYLVAENNQADGPVSSALDDPRPAENTSTVPDGSVEAVAAKMLPTVVQLQVRGKSAAGEGSGFVISSDGLIVTNNHVVEPAADNGEIVAVFRDGSIAQAEIVGRDPTSDVAVVRAEGKSGLPTVELGRSDDLRVGQSVVAIGSPFELSGTVTSGIVSSLQRPTRAGGEDGSQATVLDAIQTDAAINPGNSGGPLVDMRGRVIGINSAIYNPSGQGGSLGIGFAIPIDQARRTADEIVKTGKATQTVLGVSVQDADDGFGALIVGVNVGGPGAKAGLKDGDVVTKLNERKIDSSDALVAAVRSYAPGDKVRLELSNGSRTVDATLAGQPVETE